jgi:hypothetical protein
MLFIVFQVMIIFLFFPMLKNITFGILQKLIVIKATILQQKKGGIKAAILKAQILLSKAIN